MTTPEYLKIAGLTAAIFLNGIFDASGVDSTDKALKNGVSSLDAHMAMLAVANFGLGILFYGVAIGFLKELGPKVPTPVQALGWFGTVMVAVIIKKPEVVLSMNNVDRAAFGLAAAGVGYLVFRSSQW